MNETPWASAAALEAPASWLDLAPTFGTLAASVLLLLLFAFARERRVGFLRPLSSLALAALAALAFTRLANPATLAGAAAFEGAFRVDGLGASFDVLVLVCGLALVASARAPTSTYPTVGEREPLIVAAMGGAMLAAHAGDLQVAFVGIELSVLASALLMVAAGPRSREAARRALAPVLLVSGLMLFGIVLIYGGLASTRLDGMNGRVATVFTQWGGVQRWVRVLAEHGAEIPDGTKAQAQGEIIKGMAPAALLLPGVLLVLGALSARLGVFPFPGWGRERVARVAVEVSTLRATVVRLGVVAVFVRVFAIALRQPRLVNEPYGWNGVVPSLALLTLAAGLIVAWRSRDLVRASIGLGLGTLATGLLVFAVSANFHGHRIAGSMSAFSAEHELEWARLAGDRAFVAALAIVLVGVLASAGVGAGLNALPGAPGQRTSVHGVAGLARRRPWIAAALLICLACLAGAPPTPGFVAWWACVRSLAENSALAWMVVPLGVAWAAALAWLARIARTMFEPVEGMKRGRVETAPRAVAVVIAAALVVGSLVPDRWWAQVAPAPQSRDAEAAEARGPEPDAADSATD